MKNSSDKIPESVLRLNSGKIPVTLKEWRHIAMSLGKELDERAYLRRTQYLINGAGNEPSSKRSAGPPEKWGKDKLFLHVLNFYVEQTRETHKLTIKNAICSVLKEFSPKGTPHHQLEAHINAINQQLKILKAEWKRELQAKPRSPFLAELVRSGIPLESLSGPARSLPKLVPGHNMKLVSPENLLRISIEELLSRR